MRLVQFRCRGDGDDVRVGVEQGEGLNVVDLKAFDSSMPSTVRELLQLGDKGLECAQRYPDRIYSCFYPFFFFSDLRFSSCQHHIMNEPNR